MDTIKIAITDHCGARCATCLQHAVSPRQTMSLELWKRVLEATWNRARHLFINSTGDYLTLPNHQEYSDVLADFVRGRGNQEVSVTTNAGFYGQPRIWCSVLTCSLNAVDADAFDRHIGIEGGLSRVVDNILYMIQEHGHVEVHSLKWDGNPDPDQRLLELFGHTRARIRVSEKVENQCQTPVTGARVPCDYVDGITIEPDGRVKRCAHDWGKTSIWGTIDNLDACMAAREMVRQQHARGEFTGVCADCNYNLARPGRLYYLK